MKKCIGCGVTLQNTEKKEIGYTPKLEADYCQRCFRITHYDDLTISLKQGIDSNEVIQKINQLDSLIVWVVDLFDFESNMIKNLNDYLVGKDIIFVGTKRDLLPETLSNEKLSEFIISRLKTYNIVVKGIVITGELHKSIESYNNSIKELNYVIDYYRENRSVCVIGMANAGKSSLLNQFLHQNKLTTSRYPGTTIDLVKIDYDGYTIYDTPGITKEDTLLTHLEESKLKQIVPNSFLKPTVFQLRKNQTISVGGFVRMDLIGCENVSVVTYFKNDLYIHRSKYENSDELWNTQFNQLLTPTLATLADFKTKIYQIKDKTDFVIHGLGWICISGKVDEIKISLPNKVALSLRKGMI